MSDKTEDGAESGTAVDVKSPPTDLLHLTYEGNFQLECTSTVLACQIMPAATTTDNEEKGTVSERIVVIQLDVTTMHPQGGGQPTDFGTITLCSSSNGNGSTTNVSAQIEKVTIDRASGIVTHSGKISASPTATPSSLFYVGDKVNVCVDPDRRRILSECHTAGHVVDAAMSRCGQTFPPTKGYHFLDGPYVEYRGSVPPKERPQLLQVLKAAFQDLINEDIETTISTLTKEDAEAECNRVAQNFDLSLYDENAIRVVTVAGFACPCGGTHVKSTHELKERGWGVTALKCKKDVVRVKYGPNSSS